jgi:stage V sporulation protein G
VEITEVRIKLMAEDSGERLKAFCSITFDDCFVVRDLKIIEGASGPFVAMPSRKLSAHCPNCGSKNHLRAEYCNQCGRRLEDVTVIKDEEGRAKLYADIAHPINSTCREMIQSRVIEAFEKEQQRASLEGARYVSRYDDPDDDVADFLDEQRAIDPPAPSTPAPKTRFLPPAQKQPGPHTHRTPPDAPTSDRPRRRGGFGEGVFEDSP